jgi:hypothetical protein
MRIMSRPVSGPVSGPARELRDDPSLIRDESLRTGYFETLFGTRLLLHCRSYIPNQVKGLGGSATGRERMSLAPQKPVASL